jgi:hypothetical protein
MHLSHQFLRPGLEAAHNVFVNPLLPLKVCALRASRSMFCLKSSAKGFTHKLLVPAWHGDLPSAKSFAGA